MPRAHEAPVRVRPRELAQLLCVPLRVRGRGGRGGGREGRGDEDDGFAVRRAERARARGEVREEGDGAEGTRVDDERAVERGREEDVDAPVARLDVQVERAAGLDLVLHNRRGEQPHRQGEKGEDGRTTSTLMRPCCVAMYIRVRILSPGKGLRFSGCLDGTARSSVMCPWRVWKDALSSL